MLAKTSAVQIPLQLAPPTESVGFELLVLSYGIGQDSWTLLVKWVTDPAFRARYPARRLLVIASETGNEHDETYTHLRYTRHFCQENQIEFVHLTPELGFHAPGWQYLEHIWERKNVIGSKAYPKTCTDQLKIQPIYRFLEWWLGQNYRVHVGRKKGFLEFAETYGKIGVMIGFSAGEEKRVADPATQPVWRQKSIQMLYPLIELGMDRIACQAYLRSVGQPVPFPSNCQMCCWCSDLELLWLYRNRPAIYERWAAHEARKLAANQHKGESNLGVFGKRSLPEVLAAAQIKYAGWTDAQIGEYKMSHGHSVCSKY